MEDEIDLIDYINVLIKRKTFILAGTFLCAVTVFLYSLTKPKLYEATTKILVVSKPKHKVETETKLITETSEVNLNTYIELLKNREVAKLVIKNLGPDKGDKPISPSSIIGAGEIEQISGTDIIKLVVTDSDPEMAANISNQWAIEFVNYNSNVYSNENEGFEDIIRKQFSDSKKNLEVIEGKMLKISSGYDPATNNIITSRRSYLVTLNNRLFSAKKNIFDFESSYLDLWNILFNKTIIEIEVAMVNYKNNINANKEKIKAIKESFVTATANNKEQQQTYGIDIPYDNSNKNRVDNKEEDYGFSYKRTISLSEVIGTITIKLAFETSKLKVENSKLLLLIATIERTITPLKQTVEMFLKLDITNMKSQKLQSIVAKFQRDLIHFTGLKGVERLEKIADDINSYVANKKLLHSLKKSITVTRKELQELITNYEMYNFEYNRLKFKHENILNTYTTLGKKIEEFKFVFGMGPDNIRIIETAVTPKFPSYPNRRKIVTIGFFVGLMVTVFLSFFIEYISNAYKKEDEPLVGIRS